MRSVRILCHIGVTAWLAGLLGAVVKSSGNPHKYSIPAHSDIRAKSRHLISSVGSRRSEHDEKQSTNTIMSLLNTIIPELSSRSPYNHLRDQLNRLFELSASRAPESFGDWSPALDAFEDKDKYVVSLEVPGMKREDISVTVHDGVLTITGERKSESDTKTGTVHRSERTYGKFTRSVSLPPTAKADQIAASYKDGVLQVELPKAEEAKPKSIEVKIS